MYRIGIDLGGTNIAAGVVDEGQHIVAEVSLPTGAERPAEAVVADICRAAEKAMEKAGITAAHCASVGIGSPGTCDSANGVVVRAYNLGWFNVPVCSMVTARLVLPCHLSNDANCAALAETVAGGAVGCRNMILITLGTGIGGGIVADGQLREGVGGTGAEVGHTVLVLDGEDCTCGCHDHDHEGHHHHHHHADEVFTSWGRETIKKYTREGLEKMLEALSASEDYGIILRAKGMLPAEDGTWIYFDMVPEETEIREGAPEYTGRLCVIGSKLKEDKLAELFGLA